jgi:AbrB family looped-hinge helix DNA binding protein
MVMYHTLTSKGQLTIPHRVREEMGLQPGEKVGFMKEGDDWVLVRPRDVVRRTAGKGRKYVEALGRTYTIEEETEAYEQGVADEVIRSMSEEE